MSSLFKRFVELSMAPRVAAGRHAGYMHSNFASPRQITEKDSSTPTSGSWSALFFDFSGKNRTDSQRLAENH